MGRHELLWVCCLWIFLLVQGLVQQCHGMGHCWEEERLALLHLQPSFPFLDWDRFKRSSDCCSWDFRIICDKSTGRVIELRMKRMFVDELAYHDISNYKYLNASLFLPFQHLTTLDLEETLIAGCLKNEGFERLSSLRNLKTLNLGFGLFDNSVLASLRHLTSLRVLSLAGNKLNGSVQMQEINSLENLTKLDLSYNSIKSFEPSKGDEILNLPNLEDLVLRNNSFNNSVLSFVRGLPNLKNLDLGTNRLVGSINMKEIMLNLKSLTSLDLSFNSIESLEPSIGDEPLALPNLKTLALSFNFFNNKVLSILRGLSSLERLYLHTNRLVESISMKEFAGMKNLTELGLGNNSIKFVMAIEDGIYLKNLEKLDLSDQVHAQDCDLLQSTALFPSLKTLYLINNTFNDCTIRATETNGSANLEELDLSGSSLPSNFLHAFGALPSLATLNMKRSSIRGLNQQFIDETNGLTNLKELDLSGSSFPSNFLHAFGALPSLKTLTMQSCSIGDLNQQSIDEMNGWTNLEDLDLSGSSFPSNFLQGFGALPSLQSLLIPNCSIRGLHQQLIDGVCNLKNLQELDMSLIEASGNLPPCFSNLTALKSLDISNNPIRVPRSLEPLLNLSKLRRFYASNTEIYDHHTEFYQSVPAFQLEELDLSGQLGLAGEFPKFLYHQHDLNYVDMSHTNLSGQQFPTWLLETNPRLNVVLLANACLSGSLTLPAHSLLYLNAISYLDLSNNKLSGEIPPQISNMTSLIKIGMRNNSLEGPFPETLFNLRRLQVLDFSSNFISGTIPSTFNLPQIKHIHLSSNKLHGGLPTTLCRSSALITLDLSDNLLVDAIPRCIEELHMLSYLSLRNNSIKDTIPIGICRLTGLSVVDLSYNSFFGSIPSCLKITSHDDDALESSMHLHYWYTFRSDGIEFGTKSMSYAYSGGPLRFLIGIDLSCNKFTGEIPKEIGMLNMMHVLNLSHNGLSGGIPSTISNLKQIESLDLSFNNLGGRIPPQIVDLHFLTSFNVSFNNLSGPIPQRVSQFGADIDENSYNGNPLLCGKPLPKSCEVAGSPPPTPAGEEAEDDGFMDMGVFYITLISSYVTSLLAALLVPDWRRRWC